MSFNVCNNLLPVVVSKVGKKKKRRLTTGTKGIVKILQKTGIERWRAHIWKCEIETRLLLT